MGCALVLFIAAVVGYVNRSVDVSSTGKRSRCAGSTLQNLIDDQSLTETYDAGDLLAVDDSASAPGGEKPSVKVDGKRVKQGKWIVASYVARRDGRHGRNVMKSTRPPRLSSQS
ncbi:MAG: hypothetical protein ACLU0O_02240 [Collinsella sp.]